MALDTNLSQLSLVYTLQMSKIEFNIILRVLLSCFSFDNENSCISFLSDNPIVTSGHRVTYTANVYASFFKFHLTSRNDEVGEFKFCSYR